MVEIPIFPEFTAATTCLSPQSRGWSLGACGLAEKICPMSSSPGSGVTLEQLSPCSRNRNVLDRTVMNTGTLSPHHIPNTTGSCGSDFSLGPSCAHDKSHPLLLFTVLPYGAGQLANSHQSRYTVVGTKGLQRSGRHRIGTESQVVQVTPVPWSSHTEEGRAMGDGLPRLLEQPGWMSHTKQGEVPCTPDLVAALLDLPPGRESGLK